MAIGTNGTSTTTVTTTPSTLNHPETAASVVAKNPRVLSSSKKKYSHFYCSWIAGISSGAVSSVLVAPLDVLRTQWQVIGSSSAAAAAENHLNVSVVAGTKNGNNNNVKSLNLVATIWKREGIPGFFRGLTATLITVPAFWGVYFPLYEEFKQTGERVLLENDSTAVPPAMVHMGSAVLAGGIADVLINPLFMVRTRMQTEGLHTIMVNNNNNNNHHHHQHKATTRTSFYQTVRNLYREGGLPIFWRGMTANLLGLSHVAVQFPIYEQLKQYLRDTAAAKGGDAESSSSSLTALQLLAASAISKMCACILTYPHEVIRSRLMDSRAARVSLIPMCRDIYASHGLAGFYAGLPISMVRVVPNTAIAFCVYELVLLELKQQQQQQQQQ